jgi:hypothetical protein
VGSITFNRLASTFEIILYRMLHKLVSLNSITQEGLFNLGVSAIKVEFNSLSRVALLRE